MSDDKDANAPERARRIQRWQEMTDKIEALVREYGDVIYDPDEWADWDPVPDPPDWNNPISLTDWCLIIGVEDIDPDASTRSHWVLHVEPWQQLPYRTRGLIECRLDDIP